MQAEACALSASAVLCPPNARVIFSLPAIDTEIKNLLAQAFEYFGRITSRRETRSLAALAGGQYNAPATHG